MTTPYTDQQLRNWLQSQHLELIYGPPNGDGVRLCGVLVPGLLYVIASAPRWQDAVTEAIRIDRAPPEHLAKSLSGSVV